MARPTLYVPITNHGFGHATRTAAVVATLVQRCPDIRVILASGAPDWLLGSYLPADVEVVDRKLDIGVIQSDAVTMDKPATIARLEDLRDTADATVVAEAEFLTANDVGLVLGDIPPLAVPAAHRAGVPCFMASNFGWDFIYRSWRDEYPAQIDPIVEWISVLFGECDRLFRLPMAEPMAAFPHRTDVGLTGGDPRYDVEQLRSMLGVDAARERTALVTFGGLGLDDVPWQGLAALEDWQFVTFDQQPPDDIANLVKVTDQSSTRLRPVDVMPICSQIICKPGYGTFAEACRVGLDITCVHRRGYPEADVLVAGMEQMNRHQILEIDELREGSWDFVRREHLEPTDPNRPQPSDGNITIADAVVAHFEATGAL